jgi:hypothetical protein
MLYRLILMIPLMITREQSRLPSILEMGGRNTMMIKKKEEKSDRVFLFSPPSTVQVNLGRSPIRKGPTTVETRCWPNSAVTVNDLGGSEIEKEKGEQKL